jgi:hypothetical protein
MKKIGVISILLLLCAGLMLWADNSEEIETISEMAAAMNLFADRIDTMSSSEDFITAVTEHAETIETTGKDMVAVIGEHPEWGENPPADVEDALAEYMQASERYEPALQEATHYANDNQEDEECQKAFKRLATAMYEMYK